MNARHSSLQGMKPHPICLHGQCSCSACIQNGRSG
uniref:Uncharacterized protein n=1 Tax=Arundo donax TaxID=35708 RepID=A0A0A9FCP1_ARUDO